MTTTKLGWWLACRVCDVNADSLTALAPLLEFGSNIGRVGLLGVVSTHLGCAWHAGIRPPVLRFCSRARANNTTMHARDCMHARARANV